MSDRSPAPPNLLFVFPDQMRGSALGFLGEEPVLTPCLDQFAQESRVLTQAASNYPVCSPYRAMLMTGQYPHINGVAGNVNSRSAPYGLELSPDSHCWSDVLKEAGYSLGYIGKWHLDAPHPPYVNTSNNRDIAWNEWCPPDRRHGFDYWYAYGTYDRHLKPMYWRGDAGRDDFHYVDQWGPEHEADKAIEYFRNVNGQFREEGAPFALTISMNPPHTAYDQVPEKYVARYAHLSVEELGIPPNVPPAGTEGGDYFRKNLRNQLAMITGVDEQFGRILQALEDLGLAGNTLVIFTSDHGDLLGRHFDMHPFTVSLNKPSIVEEAMRVPFLLRFPGRVAPGMDDLLLSTPDIYPTMLDLLGLGDQVPGEVQGRSLAPALRDEPGASRPTSQIYGTYDSSGVKPGARGVRTSTHTFLVWFDDEGEEHLALFNRQRDPFQLTDCLEKEPEMAKRLYSELRRLLVDTGDTWPVPQVVPRDRDCTRNMLPEEE